MPAADNLELEQSETAPCVIPRWTPEFDIKDFDLQAVFREATAQKKSAGKLLKSLGYPVAKFIAQDVPHFKSAGAGDIPVTASTTAVDLDGDEFDVSAIGQMKAAALGTTVFLNHEYDVPEDVYGKVAGVDIVKRSSLNPVTQKTAELTCLDLQITPVGEDENPRAVKVTNMLRKSKLRLGVSVTVLVLKSKDRPDGGRIITHVFYIESSMVGIPCNQTAWAHAEASKSISTAAAEQKSVTNMLEPKTSAITGGAPAPSTTEVTEKAMYADVLKEKQNNIYLYVESFYSVFRRLQRDARGKTGDALASVVEDANTSVDEFSAELKKLLVEKIADASSQESTGSSYYDYYECWSAIGRLQNVVQKSGARNSKADQELLQQAHNCLREVGAACSAGEEQEGGEAKQASVAGHSDLQTKVASLTAEKSELETQLETAAQVAEELSKQLELEKATSEAAVAALEAFALEHLPRAGARGSVS